MGSVLFYFGVIFLQHGSTCSSYLPVVREIFFTFQRSIGIRIHYFECAGSYGSVGSGIIQPIIAVSSCIRNLVAWCQHCDG